MTVPITLAAKDPDERYSYTWTPAKGDTISGSPTLTVTDGDAEIDGSPTLVDGNETVKFYLTGGADGETTTITAFAAMVSGDEIEQTIFIPIRASSSYPTELTLDQVKRHLHILHDDDDSQLSDLARQAGKEMLRYVGQDAMDSYASELLIAQIIWVRWRYYVDEQVEIDEITGYPRAFVALAGPYRTPTFS